MTQTFLVSVSDEIPGRIQYGCDDEAGAVDAAEDAEGNGRTGRRASAGGGVVTVQMKGNHEVVALKIDPEAVKDGDVEMLQDMIIAAFNEANRKVDEAMKGKLGGMLPPGLGNLFG